MKKLFLSVFLLCTLNLFSQDCSKQHFELAKSAYIKTVGTQKYDSKIKGNKILSFEFVCDTTGKILSVKNHKIFDESFSEKDFKKFCKIFSTNKLEMCNPEPEISRMEYLKMSNYKPTYIVLLKIN